MQHLHKHSVDVLLQVDDNVIVHQEGVIDGQEIVTDAIMLKEELSANDSLVIESVFDGGEVVL